MNNLFLSCDWGTSSFRLRLIDAYGLNTLAEVSNAEGNAILFQKWKAAGADTDRRTDFYLSFLKENIDKISLEFGKSLDGLPIIISGMASSTVGMQELPYKKLPFSLNGADLKVTHFQATKDFSHSFTLVSGVCSDADVIRGEEIQLVGCQPDKRLKEQVFIIPGTHSKHVFTVDDKAVGFSTYMTGELFSLLSSQSILSTTVEKQGVLTDDENTAAFKQGVLDSFKANLLHAMFWVRTNQLFNKFSKESNYYYLSGLLIGAELKELKGTEKAITLLSSGILSESYLLALETLGLGQQVSQKSVDEAIINGHYQLYMLHYQ
ncbi:2-dehydro-3-deoxygalactonokinase [Pedobacter puniceum]|uniref:2-keto-3-deoxy-galactonokinase n=1 Tax=Pedobacter puniceum TaxID=2666136 RepID=A0A7K0FM22_9SPHI|nr:2-dehydro-3-deoxygalactonokinase [Pedobacter puniceum]MRX47008.1 2-keto-3-deoxy-galactonokinase [Pedobacter puniceum]